MKGQVKISLEKCPQTQMKDNPTIPEKFTNKYCKLIHFIQK